MNRDHLTQKSWKVELEMRQFGGALGGVKVEEVLFVYWCKEQLKAIVTNRLINGAEKMLGWAM